MFIPVKLDSDSATYYFQFDTGSNKSFIYKDKTPDRKWSKKLNYKDSIQTNIGSLSLLPSTSNTMYHVHEKMVIGTIGADFLSNKIVEIDFVNHQFNILKNYPPSYTFVPINLSYGRPVIALNHKKKNYQFMFDTGSCLFELWTIKKIWKKLKAAQSKIEAIPISSWGKPYFHTERT